jgi:hypothetical protein
MSRSTRRSSVIHQPLSALTTEEQASALSVSKPRHRLASPDPLVGRFFHSFAPKDEYPDAPTRIVQWQGHVLGRIDEHTYLIELYSWDDGLPNGQRLQPIAGMADWSSTRLLRT